MFQIREQNQLKRWQRFLLPRRVRSRRNFLAGSPSRCWLGKPGDARPATFLPSQIDDLDSDGVADQFEFPVELAPGEHRQVDVYYSTKLTDTVSYRKQVHAKHAYGYNREVAALESELIGYRTYGGFFLDFMGRSESMLGLNNDLAGYVSIYRDLGAGQRCLPYWENTRARRSLSAAKRKALAAADECSDVCS